VQGCYRDNPGARDLPVEMPGFDWTLTPTACVTACSDAGYSYAGLQVTCYCSASCLSYRQLLCCGESMYRTWTFYVISFFRTWCPI